MGRSRLQDRPVLGLYRLGRWRLCEGGYHKRLDLGARKSGESIDKRQFGRGRKDEGSLLDILYRRLRIREIEKNEGQSQRPPRLIRYLGLI